MKNKLVTILMLLTLISSILMISVPIILVSAGSTVYWVKVGGIGDGTSEENPAGNITYILTTATLGAGDIIKVKPGIYDIAAGETFPIMLSVLGITLESTDGAETTIIDAGGSDLCIKIAADNVTVSGFTVKNAKGGINFDSSVNKCTINGNIIRDISDDGIRIFGASNNKIVNNEILNIADLGIYLTTGANNTISVNHISTGGFAAVELWGAEELAKNNLFENNLIENNKIGIILFGGSENKIIANVIRNSIEYHGIHLQDTCGNVIESNTITSNAEQGIRFVGASNNTILRNIVESNKIGLYLKDYKYGNSTGNEIHYNNIIENTRCGINNTATETGDARFNWWGDASGPTHSSNVDGVGDVISDYVDYSPWLGDLFEVTPRTYHVNPTGTIQEAIDEANPSDTILVHDGTYLEALCINKSITLKAASKPIVKGSQSVATNSGGRDAVVFVENAADVTIEGLDIEGEGLSTTNTKNYAIIFEESSGTIRDCIVSPNTVGDMYSTAIGAWDSSSLTVDSCRVQNFGRIGIFYYDGCSGGVYDSTIEGQVYSDENYVNYGIEIESWSYPCDIEIIGNEIYNCDNVHPSPLWSSAGIVIDGWLGYYAVPSSTVVIESNEIHDNYYGIEVVANPYSYAHYNNIYDNREYGIIQDPDYAGSNATFDATFNWWGHETGPYHATSWMYMGSQYGPHLGQGDNVSDYVLYDPWLECFWPAPPPIISVEPPIIQAQILNKTFSINVTINDLSVGYRAVGVQFRLCYNDTLLQFVNVTQGPFMEDPRWNLHGKFWICFVEDDQIYGPNVLIGIMLYPNATGCWNVYPSGSGTLATITFKIIYQERGLEKPPLTCGLTLNETMIIDDEIEEVPHSLQHGLYEIYPTNIGDINYDGKVDMKDIGIAARAFGSYPDHERWNPTCDINGDDKIDMRDIAVVARNFGWKPTYDP